jgi:hypothetical protein
MICFAKPGLTEDLYVAHMEESSIKYYMCDTYTWQRLNIFIRDKPIFSSDRMLHKDYDRKGSVAKNISCDESQGAWHQDELIGGKTPVVK